MQNGNYVSKVKGGAERIALDRIVLVDEIHQKGEFIPETQARTNKDENLLVVVREMSDGNYALVVGWCAYMTAKHRGLTDILCHITTDSRAEFMSRYGIVEGVRNFVRKKPNPKNKPKKNTAKPANKPNREISMKVQSLKDTTEYPVERVILTKEFQAHPPKQAKIQLRVDFYKEYGKMPQAVTIYPNGKLYDGYATLEAAKQLGLKTVPVRYKQKSDKK